MNGREMIIALSLKAKGDWDTVLGMIKNKEKLPEEEAKELLSSLKCKTVTIIDPDYPEPLKRCPKPPLVLYYYGDLSLANDHSRNVAYIGSRDASQYGLEMARYFASALVERGAVVVSGMARGIDSCAQEEVLNQRGKTIAVLGSGIDCPFPSSSTNLYKRIKTNGLILSEYPNDTPPSQKQFPFRNRIIAALSKLVIVGEASKRSGTLITVGYALSCGSDVACIPTRACLESATNNLIKDGAYLLDNASDLDVFLKNEEEKQTENFL